MNSFVTLLFLGVAALMIVLAIKMTPMAPLFAFVGGVAFAAAMTDD